jgi:hypothetical protein
MKSLSISLVAALLTSTFLSATCDLECERKSQPLTDHPVSHHAVSSVHYSGGALAHASQHSCEAHGEAEAALSRQREAPVKKLAVLTESLHESPRSMFPLMERRQWDGRQRGSPLFKPRPISLRI